LGDSLSSDVLCKIARYRFLKLRDTATVALRPQWRAEEFGFKLPSSCVSDSLLNLFLRQLLRYEPAFAERELLSVENALNVVTLSWRHEVGFGEYSDAARCSTALFDEAESPRSFNIVVGTYFIISCAQL
jgi:hypothetical protein